MRTPWNICAYLKCLLTSEMFAPHLKYLRISKIYAPHLKYLRLIIYDSNKAAVEIFAPYEEYMRPNSYYLGSAESPSSDFSDQRAVKEKIVLFGLLFQMSPLGTSWAWLSRSCAKRGGAGAYKQRNRGSLPLSTLLLFLFCFILAGCEALSR